MAPRACAPTAIDALAKSGIKAIVHAGTGNGSVADRIVPPCRKCAPTASW